MTFRQWMSKLSPNNIRQYLHFRQIWECFHLCADQLFFAFKCSFTSEKQHLSVYQMTSKLIFLLFVSRMSNLWNELLPKVFFLSPNFQSFKSRQSTSLSSTLTQQSEHSYTFTLKKNLLKTATYKIFSVYCTELKPHKFPCWSTFQKLLYNKNCPTGKHSN